MRGEAEDGGRFMETPLSGDNKARVPSTKSTARR